MSTQSDHPPFPPRPRPLLRWFIGVFFVLSACGQPAESPEATTPDPMQMQRVYQAPLHHYEIGPGVRLLSDSKDRKPLKLAANVYQMPADVLELASVDERTMAMPLEGREYLKNRQVGDIIVASGAGVYWRRITGVELQGERIVWSTEPATMDEVFEEAEFFLQVDFRQVNPDQLPELDLAMPYLHPESPPQLLHTRRSGVDDGGFQESDCPVAPVCTYGTSRCVSKKNNDILCPGDDPCDERKVGGSSCEIRSGYAGSLSSARSAFGVSKNKVLNNFSCQEVAGVRRLVSTVCSSTDDCSDSDHTCQKVTDPYPGGPAQCAKVASACESNADCCSNNCGADNTCMPSEAGFCIDTCAGGGFDNSSVDTSEQTESKLTGIFNAGEDSFLKDIAINAKFKPSLTFKIKVGIKGLELLKMTVGSDFYFRLKFEFEFAKEFSKSIGGDDSFILFGFAIMGYPFSINLDIHGMARISAAVEGTLKPQFGFYTYASETMWETPQTYKSEELGPYPDSHLPFWSEESDVPGIDMGFAYSPDGAVCNDYAEGECEPTSPGGKFYKIKRFNTDKFFDPGLDNLPSIDVHAAAEVGMGVGLYDQGVAMGTRYIGLEPLNLLARSYARFQSGFCGLGFEIYYRALVKVGPIKLFGINLIKDAIPIPLVSKRLDAISFDYRIPDNVNKDCEADDANHWLCKLSEAFGCAISTVEPIIPSAVGQLCTAHSDCDEADGQRCIDQICVANAQPPGSLRVSLSWSEYKNLDLQVITPDGQTITRADAAYSDLFAGTCSNPFQAQGDCANTTLFGETLTLEAPAAGEYLLSVTSKTEDSGAGSSSYPTSFTLEIEEEGVARRSMQGQFVQDGSVAIVPITFAYEVK